MKQSELNELQAMFDALKDSKVAIYTDRQLAHYETYKGRKLSDSTKEKLRQANLGRVMSAEAKAKAIAARTGKKHNISEENKRKRTDKTSTPVNQYDLQGQLLATYESVAEACRQNNIPGNSALSKALDKGQKSNGYYWRRAPHKPNIKDEIDALVGNKMKGQTRARAIYQLDLNNKKVAEWPSAKRAGEELGIHGSNINQCCRHYPNKTIGGFMWCYKEQYL